MRSDTARRATDLLTGALRMISSLMLLAIVLINAANVAGRYVFSSPFSWGEEIMLFLMIGSIFLSWPAVTWDGANIRMDILVRSLPVRFRRLLEGLADLVSIVLGVLVICVGVPVILQLIAFDDRSHAANVLMAIPQGAIPLGFVLSLIALIGREVSGKAAEHAAEDPE